MTTRTAFAKGRGFGVILADPPWKFTTHSAKGLGKSPERHYPTMTVDEIASLPVGRLAAKDCALFLWTTWPILLREDAPVHRIVKEWGFRLSGLAWEWLKFNRETGKFAFAGGYGSRKNLEPCVLALRGHPKLMSRSERDFMFDKRREHSRKPDEQYERIERMYPAGPFVELFARARRKRWISWGNDVGRFGVVR